MSSLHKHDNDVSNDSSLKQEVTSLTIAFAHLSFPLCTIYARENSVLFVVNNVTLFAVHDTFVAMDIGIGLSASCWFKNASNRGSQGGACNGCLIKKHVLDIYGLTSKLEANMAFFY